MSLNTTPIEIVKVISSYLGLLSFLKFTSTCKLYFSLRESPERAPAIKRYHTKCYGRNRRIALFQATKIGDFELVEKIIGNEKIYAPESILHGYKNRRVVELIFHYHTNILAETVDAIKFSPYYHFFPKHMDFATAGCAMYNDMQNLRYHLRSTGVASTLVYFIGKANNQDALNEITKYSNVEPVNSIFIGYYITGLAKGGHIERLKGIDFNALGKRMFSDHSKKIIYAAVASGHVETAKFVIDITCEHYDYNYYYLWEYDRHDIGYYAGKSRNPEMAKFILEFYSSNPKLSSKADGVLWGGIARGACASGNIEIFSMIEPLIQTSIIGCLLFQEAVTHNCLEMVDYLCSKCSVYNYIDIAIGFAYQYGNYGLSKYLKSKKEKYEKKKQEFILKSRKISKKKQNKLVKKYFDYKEK